MLFRSPAMPELDTIAKLATLTDVARALGDPKQPLGGPFDIGITADEKSPDDYVVEMTQGGLGMPNRDYYLREDEALSKTREAYKKHIAKMLALAGFTDTDAKAQRIYDVEHKIAEAQWANADRRNRDKTYNPMTLSELKTAAPEFPWSEFVAATGVSAKKGDKDRIVIVAENTAFPKLAKIFAETPVETWRDYMVYHYLTVNSAYLPRAFDEENFAFYGTSIEGNPKQLEIGRAHV